MAMNSGTTKRQREMARRQRQQEKAAKMQKRQEEKRVRAANAIPGEDPDIAGIVLGPQPREDDDFEVEVP
jgi:hypothetical protein